MIQQPYPILFAILCVRVRNVDLNIPTEPNANTTKNLTQHYKLMIPSEPVGRVIAA